MIVDLHTHTLCSDGTLSPGDLVALAQSKGVTMLSITDHDTVEAYHQLAPSMMPSITLINGIEFSTQWSKTNIHVIGLNINIDSDAIRAGVSQIQKLRQQRAEKIAEKLEKIGAPNVLEGAADFAMGAPISRVHFANYLVSVDFVKSEKEAFKRYLGSGKAGDIKKIWPPLNTIVSWIKDAGGIAVLAHPRMYKLTRTKLIALLKDFIRHGGQGLEVCSGHQPIDQTKKYALLANEHKLYCSMGSDFHCPNRPWVSLGMHRSLPEGCLPIWDTF